MSLFLKEKHCTFNEDNFKLVLTLKKYTLYIANVVNDYSSCKYLVLVQYWYNIIEAHFQQLSLQCYNGDPKLLNGSVCVAYAV